MKCKIWNVGIDYNNLIIRNNYYAQSSLHSLIICPLDIATIFFMAFHAHIHTPTYIHTLEFFIKHIFSWHMHFYLQKYQVTAGFLLPYALYAFAILKISRSETRNSTFQSNFCFTLIPVFAADRNFEQYTTRYE